jgi:hypothetical protein
VVVVAFGSGCLTPSVLEPRIRAMADVALLSVWGTSDLLSDAPWSAGPFGGAMPSLPGIDIEDAALELLVGDTLGLLESIYGEGHVLQPSEVRRALGDGSMPELTATTLGARVERLPIFDLDDAATPELLARVARRLDVDATVVVRHEWWLERERHQLLQSAFLTDRCLILMVDRDGVVLWRDVAVARAPLRLLGGPTPWGSLGPTADLIGLARQTGRRASAELTARVMRLPLLPPGAAVRTKTPPAPLEQHGQQGPAGE